MNDDRAELRAGERESEGIVALAKSERVRHCLVIDRLEWGRRSGLLLLMYQAPTRKPEAGCIYIYCETFGVLFFLSTPARTSSNTELLHLVRHVPPILKIARYTLLFEKPVFQSSSKSHHHGCSAPYRRAGRVRQQLYTVLEPRRS